MGGSANMRRRAPSAARLQYIGVRLAVTRNGDDKGWIENVNNGQELPTVNNLAGRLTLAYAPVEHLDATLKMKVASTGQLVSPVMNPFNILIVRLQRHSRWINR